MKSTNSSKCCFCCDGPYSSSCCIKTPHVCIKLVQIILMVLDLVATEIGLFFLSCINVEWRRGEFPNIDLHRAVLWFSLATTSAILFFMRKIDRGMTNPQRGMRCPICGGYEELESIEIIKPVPGWTWDHWDYIHSLLTATGFLVCSLSSIIDIPKFYEHHVEVDIKIIGFLLDLILTLLYTKSCISAYTRYQMPYRCNCATVEWTKTSSCVPSSGDETSDEESKQSLLKSNFKRTKDAYSNLNNL